MKTLTFLLLIVAIFPTASAFSAPAVAPPARALARFAGGCFWCEEAVFDGVPGVIQVVSGYTGGSLKNPNAEQKRLAEASKAAIEASHRFKQPIVTQIVPASTFYRAEEYHQNYHEKNPVRYRFYKYNCGRDQRLRELWGEK